MGEPVVLVVGEVGDWSADAVADAVTAADGRVFRLTTHDFPQRMRVGARFDGRWTGTIGTGDGELSLDRVTAVYYRRPRTFDLPAGLSGPEERFARAQARMGLGGVLASLPARWVNHPSALADCEYKPRQLAVAANVGLHPPPTLITNDPERVQRWIEPRYAVRLTAVAAQLFPVAIHPGSQDARTDWRADYDHLAYEVVDAPEPVRSGVARFLAAFGLVYGAFDFIVEQGTGDWYLMECNAGGQWGWVAEECELPIADAIAADLIGADR